MASARLEHINITVSNPERSAALLTALTGWRERWRGPAQLGGSTIHLGNDSDYIALYCPAEPVMQRFAKGMPMQHIGLVVDDLDAAEAVAIAHGLTPFNHADYDPGRRFYFFDEDGIEWEMVSYA